VTNPYTFKSLPYDPLTDFVPVGKIADGPFLLLANPEVSAKTLSELITLAKASPGKLTFAYRIMIDRTTLDALHQQAIIIASEAASEKRQTRPSGQFP